MVSQSIKSHKNLFYALFALVILVVSWESNLASAALLAPTIPEESIRIRILANSDSPEDQWIKREIQHRITAEVNSWHAAYTDIESARAIIREKLPELERVVGEELTHYGFDYGHEVVLGQVYFPAKVFGKETYPAGEYEALRITLGEGAGENWWCVMFPPLCFGGGTVKAKAGIPIAGAEAGEAKSELAEDAGSVNEEPRSEDDRADVEAEVQADRQVDTQADRSSPEAGGLQGEEEVEVRFFLVDLFHNIVDFFKGLFK